MSASVRSYVQAPALLCAAEITLIFKNRKKILSEFFTSIGITAASTEAWDRVMEGVEPVDEDFECSGWALK